MPPLTPVPDPLFVAEVIRTLEEAETTSPRYGRPVVITFDEDRNYFAQFAPGDEDGKICAEIVGQEYLQPQYRLAASDLNLLLQYGWTPSEDYEPPNHARVWDTALTGLDLIVKEVMALACALFKTDGETATIEV